MKYFIILLMIYYDQFLLIIQLSNSVYPSSTRWKGWKQRRHSHVSAQNITAFSFRFRFNAPRIVVALVAVVKRGGVLGIGILGAG